MVAIWQRSTGTEELLDVVEEVLIRDIDSALAEVYERMVESDMARAERRQVEYIPMTYDQVPPSHFHTGNFPSLVLNEVPKDAYPFIVLTIEEYAPSAIDSDMDQVNVYREALVIHCLAKANPEEGSEVVFRRAIRMGEAVYLSLASEPSLRTALAAFVNPVRSQPSIPWTAQEDGHGEDFWYQAVGTTYGLTNRTTMAD